MVDGNVAEPNEPVPLPLGSEVIFGDTHLARCALDCSAVTGEGVCKQGHQVGAARSGVLELR